MSAARSASGCLMTAALALTVLTGCDSTQQQAARARLKAARFLASATPTVVRDRNANVSVLAVTLVHGSGGAAIAVRLRNDATRPLNDLPISVGIVHPGGRRTYLNASPGSYYFETHLASIAARGSLTWVFTTTRRLPAAATPFALVGSKPSLPPTRVRALPRIDVTPAGSPIGAPQLKLTVTNASAVPQYQLQVYALGLAGGRYVAAGRRTISHLGTGSTQTLAVPLIRDRPPTSIELEALPTMLQ